MEWSERQKVSWLDKSHNRKSILVVNDVVVIFFFLLFMWINDSEIYRFSFFHFSHAEASGQKFHQFHSLLIFQCCPTFIVQLVAEESLITPQHISFQWNLLIFWQPLKKNMNIILSWSCCCCRCWCCCCCVVGGLLASQWMASPSVIHGHCMNFNHECHR